MAENKNLPTTQKKNLPKIADLYSNAELAVKSNDLNILLNQEPHPSWIVKNPFIKKEVKDPETGRTIKVPLDYLPIGRVEWLLTSIFQTWNVEIKNFKLIANSIAVEIRLHYVNPVTGIKEFQDGGGAVALQTDKGAGATDFNSIKSDAVMKAFPAAKSYAIKDAADHLGKLFGKDLNREHQADYVNLQGTSDALKVQELKLELSGIVSLIHDEKVREAAIEEINEAEANEVNTVDFYTRMIENYG